jgi:hypothetical protein
VFSGIEEIHYVRAFGLQLGEVDPIVRRPLAIVTTVSTGRSVGAGWTSAVSNGFNVVFFLSGTRPTQALQTLARGVVEGERGTPNSS